MGIRVCGAVLLLMALPACKKKDPRAAEALERDRECASDIAGPKSSEARVWCDAGQTSHMGFKMGRDEMLVVTEDFYGAGADKVYVVGIDTLADKQIAAQLAVMLPGDKSKRAAIFAAEKKLLDPDDPTSGTPDVGQRCLLVSLD